VQSVIAARIDRLRPDEKSALNAGSVIGSGSTLMSCERFCRIRAP